LAQDKFHPILLPIKPCSNRWSRAKYCKRQANIQVWEGVYSTTRLPLWVRLLPEYNHYPKISCL
jgi:hypothetical protein